MIANSTDVGQIALSWQPTTQFRRVDRTWLLFVACHFRSKGAGR